VGTYLLIAGPDRLDDDCALPRGAAKRGRFSVAILASRATRPVRWRRHLRAACFWLAVALGTAAVAKDLLGPFFYVLMVPPLAFGLRELIKAFGARDAGRLAERVADKLTTALGPEYVVLTEYSPRAG